MDVNVLVAVVDENHQHHVRAYRWFVGVYTSMTWLGCPITQSGAIRVLSNPNVTSAAPTSSVAAQRLVELIGNSSHEFVTDGLNLLEADSIRLDRITSHKQITDTCLLALAVHHQAIFATMDRRGKPDTVAGGANAYLVIP